MLHCVFVVKHLDPIGSELFLGLRLEDRQNHRIVVSQGRYARQMLLHFGMAGYTSTCL